jgi:hypothetical protein
MKIVDDFLAPHEIYDEIANPLMDTRIPLALHNGGDYVGDGHWQFVHVIYGFGEPQSRMYDQIMPICSKVNELMPPTSMPILSRAKINVNYPTATHEEWDFHRDSHFPHYVGILYLNDNNGYTEFETGEKVYCKANRFVWFDGRIKHRMVSSTDTIRAIVNTNFLVLDCFEGDEEFAISQGSHAVTQCR